MSDFKKLKDELKVKLSEAKNSQEVDIIRTNIFGKNGLINSEFKKLGSLSLEDKKKVASEINNVKQELTKLFLSLFRYSSLIFIISDILLDYF